MPDFDSYRIMTRAYEFASLMIMDKEKTITAHDLLALRSEDAFASKFGKTLIENLILGALLDYHWQLRESLLKKGIDIGDFE